jgi:hypothetical protein
MQKIFSTNNTQAFNSQTRNFLFVTGNTQTSSSIQMIRKHHLHLLHDHRKLDSWDPPFCPKRTHSLRKQSKGARRQISDIGEGKRSHRKREEAEDGSRAWLSCWRSGYGRVQAAGAAVDEEEEAANVHSLLSYLSSTWDQWANTGHRREGLTSCDGRGRSFPFLVLRGLRYLLAFTKISALLLLLLLW